MGLAVFVPMLARAFPLLEGKKIEAISTHE
jgi:hypothetical protein